MAAAWALLSVAACVSWALWGFFGVLAERRLSVESAFAWHCLAIAACASCAAPFVGLSLPLDQIFVSLAGGVGYAAAAVWMMRAIAAGGPGGIVVTLTALYPAVVLLLGVVFLNQMVSFVQLMGVVLAMISTACVLDGPGQELEGDVEDKESSICDKTARPANTTWWWLSLSLLALLGYAASSFSPEVCVVLPSAEGLSVISVGSRLIWQAIGCTFVCLVTAPCCILEPEQAWASPAPCNEAVPLLCRKSAGQLVSAGVGSALAMGVTLEFGFFAYNVAVVVAPAEAMNAIVLISGLYPALTVLLTRVLLDEQLSLRQYSGIVLALVAARLVA